MVHIEGHNIVLFLKKTLRLAPILYQSYTTVKTDKKIYFLGINGLRFLAALAVIITHTELLKKINGFKNYWENPIIFNLGGLGVYFFFVLSGFLITYLLLEEKEKNGTINIKQFYIRRILRIWPLYYFIVLIGFFILPEFDSIQIPYLQNDFITHYNTNLVLYLLILPNLAFSMFSAVPHIGQAWSIGVEEQFYLIWPLIISKTKRLVRTLIFVVLGLVLFKIIVLAIGLYCQESFWYMPLKRFVAMSKFECMAIGGIGAYLLFSNKPYISFIYYKQTLILSLALIVLLVYITPDKLQDGIHLIYSVLFLIIIIHVSDAKNSKLLENKIFNYLGKISYGIYMYHFMIIPIVLVLVKKHLSINSGLALNLSIYLLAISLTILISGVSYHILESPFIRKKNKYSPIKSGNSN